MKDNWIKICGEKDLPKEDGLYYTYSENSVSPEIWVHQFYKEDNYFVDLTEGVEVEEITHYLKMDLPEIPTKKYGQLPRAVDYMEIDLKEMMYYQYLPIKLYRHIDYFIEPRLKPLEKLIDLVINDYKKEYGDGEFVKSYIYLTVKRQYISKDKLMNRPGYHSDGFMTDDINYIWSDSNPTIFNYGEFDLTMDDKISMKEMENQALLENEIVYPNNTILKLDQFNIHKANDRLDYEGMRSFVKISFSKDRYNLEGNSHNYELDYNWKMRPRTETRNIPNEKKVN